ncbi:MAG TPA: VOC family protein [Candidatus Dormibacteraeota bacterium]|nr:VOC family protein [Candidatus Dormibacteraeota bacterium]
MALKRVHHIGVAVSDLARARQLLGEQLGLRLVREQTGSGPTPSVAFYQCGEVQIELLEHSRPEDRAAWLDGDRLGRIEHIAIEVDDLAATLEALQALGVTADPPRPGPLGTSARTRPDTTTGIVLQLLQPAG